MASHGVARTNRSRTEEQKQQELDKINKYRDLETQIRSHTAVDDYSPEVFQITTKLLRLNPEYYTIWNVRRRLLISGLLSKRSAGSSPSRESPSSSRTATTTASSAASYSSSSTTTQPNPRSQTTGKSGTIADKKSGGDNDADVGEVAGNDDKTKAQQNDLEMLKAELGFTVPLLMEAPKCYWIWKYRSWLLQEAIDRLEPLVARRVWEEELALDTKMLTRDRRNFHAWGYRRNVVKHLESIALDGASMVEAEFEFTTKMIRVDLSNFSAWHNRSKLIPRLLTERKADDAARRKFFDQELALIRDALNVGPEDQSLWYYHQFLILDIIEYVDRPTITAGLTIEDRASYISQEVIEIKDLLEDYDDCKLIYERLMDCTLALAKLEERNLTEEEVQDLRGWLTKLRDLDPKRNGRWHDVQKELGLRR